MPNQIAFLALAASPIFVAVMMSRLRLDRAIIWSLMLCYLFLPEPPAVFDFPMMPPLDKHNIPALMAFALTLWRKDTGGPLLPQSGLGKVLLLTFVFSPVMTVLNNGEPIYFGIIGLPALGLKDAAALVLEQFLMVLPFLLGRQHLASGGAMRELLRALVVGGLIYTPLMLLEMRVSPQLNNWVYGYFQHFFAQTIRFGGYRPIVFLYHGIWVAFFLMTSVVSAWALWRWHEGAGKIKALAVAGYLTLVLVMAKSLGALIFMVLLVPLVVLLAPRTQLRIALLIGAVALAYPILKGADLVPQEQMLAQAEKIDPDRAGSLRFRFQNEDTLLERAYIKPVFGWGSWGRNHILDPFSGAILTVTDGFWIVSIGTYGWVGFLAQFGLLLWPLVLIWRAMSRQRADAVSPFVGPLSLMLAINVADMIPNATLTPLTWLIAGALTGYAERLREATPRRHQAASAAPLRRRTAM
ncbi:membrane protein [Mameliella alba]|uniref:Membrane protein n=1 Tax=Mameliella alba TaxID=561184 RepID=A0A0B3RQS7_9RHOB|nr:membrane protein [Mameliella alba]KHQ53425.1 Membrane protein [Mameliella alba]